MSPASFQISVYEELGRINDKKTVNINEVNERNSKRLFNGIVQNIRTTNVNGIYYLEIQALTSSFKLDIKKKSRSFQNFNMTYDDIINNILTHYPGYGFTQNVGKEQAIGKPLFQYNETDWNFLKRIASELYSELYCDIINLNNMFNFGRPQEHAYTLRDDINYRASKNLKRFHEAGGDAKYHDTDYFYYEVKIRDKLEICSEIYFKQKELYIREYEAYVDRGEILYKYKLCRKNGVWQETTDNKFLRGVSLEGKVLAVEGEFLKLHLNIDENQNVDEASWFYYAPPTVNIVYSMPLVGTSARLYFPNESSENPIVTGCVRKNGDTCEEASDTTKRYFQIEHGSEIAMLPDALNIKGGSKETLSISFDDSTGITLTSPKRLSLNAGGEITITTPKSVNINSQSQILMKKGNTLSEVSLEGEINISAGATVNNGSDRTGFGKYTDDEPKAASPPRFTKNKSTGIDFVAACKAQNLKGNNESGGFDFVAACSALNGNTSLCGSVITNGNNNTGSSNSNFGNSNNSYFDKSQFVTPGNNVSNFGSGVQFLGATGKDVVSEAISNVPKTSTFEWKSFTTVKAAEVKALSTKVYKAGDLIGKGSIGVDVAYGIYTDVKVNKLPIHEVTTNAVVNATFDYGSLWACTAAGSVVAGPLGTAIGFGVGFVIVGATQVWTPIKKIGKDGNMSIQDAVKDRLAHPDEYAADNYNKTDLLFGIVDRSVNNDKMELSFGSVNR